MLARFQSKVAGSYKEFIYSSLMEWMVEMGKTFMSSRWLYDYRVGCVRIKIMYIVYNIL